MLAWIFCITVVSYKSFSNSKEAEKKHRPFPCFICGETFGEFGKMVLIETLDIKDVNQPVKLGFIDIMSNVLNRADETIKITPVRIYEFFARDLCTGN